MSHITDTVVAIALVIFFTIGAFKGFLYSLIGPVSLIAGVLASIYYYSKTNNMLYALAISVIAPIVINLIFLIAYKVFQKHIAKIPSISGPSRFLGGLVSLLWSGALLGLTLALITLIPLDFSIFKTVKNDILRSRSYAFIDALTGDKITAVTRDLDSIFVAVQDPQLKAQLEDNPQVQEVVQDPSLQDLMSDEMTREQIISKDFSELLKNKKFQAVLQNKELVKKIFDLQKAILNHEIDLPTAEQTTKAAEGQEEQKNQPAK